MREDNSLTYRRNGITMPRTTDEIIADIEIWAKERLASGEETLYLSGIVARDSGSVIREEHKSIDMQKKETIKSSKTSSVTEIPKSEPRTTNHESRITVPQPSDDWKSAADLPMLKSMISGCTKCELYKTRTNFVFGVGNPGAKVMVIGEAPGADEDKQGEPFVGRAGQLLNKMLLAINFPREEVYIANILKSRPPGNRDPKPEEVAACEPYLFKQIELIKPKMILCVGRVAGSNLLKFESDSLAKMRGKVFDFMGAKVMVTYHPAALMRNPAWKVGAWEDLKQFRKLYDEIANN